MSIIEFYRFLKTEYIIKLVESIKELDWYHKTTFISFDKENITNLRKNYNDSSIQFLTGEATEETFNFLLENNCDLDIYYKSLYKEYIDKLHQYNILVNCWTVDVIKDAQDLIDLGVDMITSNCLE